MNLDKCKKAALEDVGIPAELYDELVRDFVPEAEESVAELNGALESGDLETVKRAVHKIHFVSFSSRIAMSILAEVESSSTTTIFFFPPPCSAGRRAGMK